MQEYDKAVAAGRPQPNKYVKSLGLAGWYRCCYPKWRRAREKGSWQLLCSAAPGIAKRFKETPDVIRKFLGQPCKFKERCRNTDGSTCILPLEFQNIVSEAVATCLQILKLVSLYTCEILYKYIYNFYIYISPVKIELFSEHVYILDLLGATRWRGLTWARKSIMTMLPVFLQYLSNAGMTALRR